MINTYFTCETLSYPIVTDTRGQHGVVGGPLLLLPFYSSIGSPSKSFFVRRPFPHRKWTSRAPFKFRPHLSLTSWSTLRLESFHVFLRTSGCLPSSRPYLRIHVLVVDLQYSSSGPTALHYVQLGNPTVWTINRNFSDTPTPTINGVITGH